MPSASKKIASIIHNQPLADAIQKSVSLGLTTPFFHHVSGKTVWGIFQHSLDEAIRDIEEHPQGHLFRRLVEFGPHDPDEPKVLESDGKTLLSDKECGTCVEFVFSLMVNRFKGELAELLAIEPCIALVRNFQNKGSLSASVRLYWGDVIKERRKITKRKTGEVVWGGFAKGADGLLLDKSQLPGGSTGRHDVKGACEVKSMRQSPRKLANQITKHISRLNGGLRLGKQEYPPQNIHINNTNLLRIMVMPSAWKLSRQWQSIKTDRGSAIVIDDPDGTPEQNQFEEIEPNSWRITLGWSQEAIEQAAYEMTFWYMSQVGKSIYATKVLPKGWEYMTPEEAGYNAIKEKLYYIPLRYISKRQIDLATKLYNIYCYSYPLGVDSKEMLWPQDFPHTNQSHLV